MKQLTMAVSILVLGACDRTHLEPSFGRATRASLALQVIHPDAGYVAKLDQGLDPEEASIVSDGYRQSLAPKKAESASSRPPVFLITNDQGHVAPMPPPPNGGP
jgi:hypothetical protein